MKKIALFLAACLLSVNFLSAQSVFETEHQRAPGLTLPAPVSHDLDSELHLPVSTQPEQNGEQIWDPIGLDSVFLASVGYNLTMCLPLTFYNFVNFNVNEQPYPYGYLNGTSAPMPRELFATPPENPFQVADQAISFTLPASFTRAYYVSEVVIPWAPGSQIVGDADDMAITLYSGASQNLTPIYTQEFRIDDLPGFPDKVRADDDLPFVIDQQTYDGLVWRLSVPWYSVFFDDEALEDGNELPTGSQAFVSLETRRLVDTMAGTWTDDTLCVYVQGNRWLCNPNDVSNWWFSFKDAQTGQMVAWLQRNAWWEGEEEVIEDDSTSNHFSQPWIIPVLAIRDLTSTPDINAEMGSMGDLTLYTAYPNPAVDFTNIRYDLKNSSNVTVVVRDMTGRSVYMSEQEFQGPGDHVFELDTRAFACGAYTYIVVTDNGMLGGRFLVEK